MMLDRVVHGQVPKKHHIQMRDKDGVLFVEECFTRSGFDGPYTIMYHRHRPHTASVVATKRGWKVAKPAGDERALARRHYPTQTMPRSKGRPLDVRTPLLANADVVISVMKPEKSDDVWFVNADADELFFVHEGAGVLRSILGDVAFEKHDYVFVPRGLQHRFLLDEKRAQSWLSLECKGQLDLLKQWRNECGQLRMDAPYSHRDFKRPVLFAPTDDGIRDVVVKRGDAFHGFRAQHPVADVVGWDGTVYPWVFPISCFQARVGMVHLPPTWHGTFGTRGALICSFVPRPVDFHPEAIPCPYPHTSVDCDEVLFYCDGKFTSRKGVGPGSISHHPTGVTHGPHPGAYEASIGTRETTELAVMLDTTLPLWPTAAALAIEDPEYHASFIDPSGR
jgi:homogentisate 1,2-dioxygenase